MKRVTILVLLTFAAPAYAVDPLPPSQIPPSEAIEGMREAESRRIEGESSMANGLASQAGFWTEHGISIIGATADFIAAFRALTTTDATCMDLSAAGAPGVPTSCADSEACGQCFTDAKRRIDGMRINLERLRCVYTAAANFTRASIAFGDSASGIHAVTGLQWQTQKAEIQHAFESLKHTYDVKYGQMLPNLQESLGALAECENRFFRNPDWYSRFGFMYYSFMADRYKRSD